MPFYEVPYKDRARFPINYMWITIDEINETEGVYSLKFVDNGSGSLCATTNALKIYAEQLGNFILGNGNSLIPDNKNKEVKEFYESFIVNEAIEYSGIATKSRYLLGIYINERGNTKFFSHAGLLPAAQSRMYILYDENKIKDIKVITWQNEIYSNIATNFLLDIIEKITEKSIDKKIRKDFEKILKEEFIDKDADISRKREICKALEKISNFVKNNIKNKNFNKEFRDMLNKLNHNGDRVLKSFYNSVLAAIRDSNL